MADYPFDALMRIKQIHIKKDTTDIMNCSYVYDKVGNIMQKTTEKSVESTPMTEVASVSCNDCKINVPFNLSSIGGYSGVWWIGVSLWGSAVCSICVTCNCKGDKKFVYSCSFTTSINDQFINPLDFDNSGTDPWDHMQFGGTPFYVTGKWIKEIAGSGSL